jgi:hypothetical protein
MKKTEDDSLLNQGMNILAGLLLVVYTLLLGAYATTGLNAIWVAIGLSTRPLQLFTLVGKWLIRN